MKRYAVIVAAVLALGAVFTHLGRAQVVSSSPSGVTSIIAGTNVTISPVGGTGAVTVNASGGGGGLSCTAGTTPVAAGNVGCNTISVTSAQLKALSTTPVTLLTTPGVGNTLYPLDFEFSYTFGTVQYANGSSFLLNYGGGGDSLTTVSVAQSMLTAASSQFVPGWVINNGPFTTSSDTNQSLILKDTVDYTAGDGTLKVTVFYKNLAN